MERIGGSRGIGPADAMVIALAFRSKHNTKHNF
jgi:hypothetical protein